MEYYFVYCPECNITYSFTGYKTSMGKSETQLVQMWNDSHVCRNCGGSHLIDAEGGNDYQAHYPINEKKAGAKIITSFSCHNRECWHSFLAFDMEKANCPRCNTEVDSALDKVDLSEERVNPYIKVETCG